MDRAEQFAEALRDAGIIVDPLTALEIEHLKGLAVERLGVQLQGWPWDRKQAPRGHQDENGWQVAPELVGTDGCIMFLDLEPPAFRLPSAASVVRVLEQLPPVEFYLIAPDARYMLCFNHHDFLVGWGEAEAWLKARYA
jgi:hypothetical protein